MRTMPATGAKQNLGALLDPHRANRPPFDRTEISRLFFPAREYGRLRAINMDELERFCDRIGRRGDDQRVQRGKDRGNPR